MLAFIHGLILSLGLILPLGVQNVFVFNQGATHKRLSQASPSIITAGVCDTILIVLAVSGLSVVVLNFEWLKIFIIVIGIIFLVYMGFVMWKSTSDVENSNGANKQFTPRRQITFAASVSLLNPHAIIDTIGVIGTSSLAYTGQDKLLFAVACIAVSWFWFFLLAILGRKVGQVSKNKRLLIRINQLSAIIIWIMAGVLGFTLFSFVS